MAAQDFIGRRFRYPTESSSLWAPRVIKKPLRSIELGCEWTIYTLANHFTYVNRKAYVFSLNLWITLYSKTLRLIKAKDYGNGYKKFLAMGEYLKTKKNRV